jgi:hypothetical protein
MAVDSLLLKSMKLQSLDNLSIVLVTFRNFKTALQQAWETKYLADEDGQQMGPGMHLPKPAGQASSQSGGPLSNRVH